ELSPDVVVCDRPGFEAHGQVFAAGCPPPALLWLLPLGATVPTPAAWPQAPYDYLFTDQLGGDRLHLSLHNLWQQHHLQQQLDHCRQLGEVFHQAGVGINQTDAAGHYIRANQQFCTLVGYSEAELRQLTYHHITHPGDLATQVELERQLFAGEITNTTFEKRFMARDGRIVWAGITLSAVYDGQPHPVSDLAIVEDITDRVQLKAERRATAARLVKSEARLMEAQRMAHLGHWEYDLITDDILWSQELLRQYGLDETLSGPSFETFAACIHPEDWPALNQAIQVLINAGTPYALRHRIVRPDGTVRHTFCKGQAVVNGQGQVIKLFGVSQDVTEAWEAEQALQASERRYRQLVENLPNGAVQTLDCQGTVTFIGGKMLTVLGLDPRQVIGRHASEILEPGAWAQVEPCLRQTLAGHPTQWEMPWWNHHFLFSATPLYGPDGEAVVGILCISQNITPLKQVEAALRHSEQKHRALVQALPDLIMHIDREGVYLDFFAANNMTVIGDTEGLIGQNLQEQGLPDELADLRMAYIRQALETGTLQRYEQTLCNGQMQVIEEVRVVPVGNAEVLVIVRDITGQAQLEAQRRQAEQELRDSERRYATLTETAPVGIFRFDAAENCVYVNPRWCEMTGRTLAMVQGGAWQAMLHPEDRERLLAGWAKALARRAPYRNEGRHLHTDGTVVWFDLQMMPEFDDQGALLGYVGTVSDISDRKQAELALRQAKEELDHFFSVALDLLCIATTDGHFLRLNPAWETTLGYSLAELQAQTFLHWVHEADVDSTRAALAQLGAQKEILNFVNRYRHRDGSYRWIEWRSFPRGHLIYAAARDITHRKTAEMRLERQNALLAQIAQGEPCPTILQALVVEIEIQLPEALASILLLDEQRRFHC
ncbi:MAG: PAS domain S-box protein, partial [Cyanobacteria bacterium]|nr:PAS domain S-box protein [Cyanobacteriota bacterium]